MPRRLTIEQTRQLRLRAQRLHPAAAQPGAGDLIRQIGALQAQELPSATLAIRARTHGLTVEDVRQAREVERSMVLTWAMRGTLHLIPAEDVGWLLALYGPRTIRSSERRYRQLGLSQEIREQAARLLRDTLTERGPLTRAELAGVLAPHGIPVAGQAMPYLLSYAAMQGTLCFGPERDGDLTYVVLADWLSAVPQRTLSDEQMPAELARRYLDAYGPAAPADFAAWSGLPVGWARAGFESIADDLAEVEARGEAAWMLKEQLAWLDGAPGAPVVRLLPRYDSYLLGYTSRAFMVDDAFARRIHPGGGLLHPALIVDARAVATWRTQRQKNRLVIAVEPFKPLDPAIIPPLEAEVQDMGRFLGQETALQV
ncbi:MAG: winged helix DNA-binding domain-containing protein [Chloroflexi bacterium]|nr:winged helix DNA-binding domain-containing protein [Chloroflexota bacterium]